MSKRPARTADELAAENEELRARLEEAEETLRAIRAGEVDALVVATEQGERLFTLKGAEHSYRILIEDMNEGAVTLSPDGGILYCNRRFAEMLKAPLEKVIGSAFRDWIAPESQTLMQGILQQDEAQSRRRAEVVLRASDGTFVPSQLSINDLRAEELTGYYCMVVTDLTEYKQVEAAVIAEKLAREKLEESERSRRVLLSMLEDQKLVEQALRESEEKYHGLFENVPDGIFRSTPGGEILAANRALAASLGYESPQELMQSARAQDLYADSAQRDRNLVALRERGEIADLEVVLKRRDGARRVFLENAHAVRDEAGEILYYEGVLTDITERKRAEEALRESVNRYQMATRATKDVIWEWILATDELIWSDNAYLVFGYDPEEVAPYESWWDDHIHPEDRQRVLSKLNAAIAGTDLVWSDEYRFLLKDGSYARISDRGYIERDADGKALRVVGAMSDVTETKRAEEQLRLQAAALQAAANAIIITDREGRIQWVNPAFTALTGYTAEESLGRNLRELLRSGVQDKGYYQNLWNTILSGQVWRGELINRRKDGTFYIEEMTIAPLRDEQQQVSRFIAIKQDVTQRKQAEEMLRKAEEKYRILVEQLPMIVYANPAQELDSTVFVSPQIEQILGYTPEEWLRDPKFWQEALHPDDRQRVLDLVRGLDPDSQTLDLEYRMVARDGRVVWFRDQAVLVRDRAGQPAYWQGLMTDISEQKRLEEQMRRRLMELEALYQSGIAFGQTFDQYEIAEKVIEVLVGLLDWHHAAVRVRRGETDELELLAFSHLNLQPGDEERLRSRVTRVGEGLAGWVVEHGRALRIGNLEQDARYVETFSGMKSGLYVPMRIFDRKIGCISVESERLDAFTEADERMVTTLAVQAAVAIENARLYASALEAAQRRSVLYQTSQEMVQITQDLEQIYAAVHRAVSQIMPAEAFTIVLVNESQNELEAVYLYDKGGRWPAQHIRFGEGFSSLVITSGKSILIDDVEKTPIEAFHYGSEDHTRSVLAVPMRAAGRIIGMISTQSYEPNAFTRDDQRLLEMLATQASIAIENARLFQSVQHELGERRLAEQELQRRAEEFQALYETARVLSGEVDLPAALEKIVEEAIRLLDTANGTLALYDAARGDLELVAAKNFPMVLGSRRKLGEGMAGKVAQTRQPMIVNNYQEWEHRVAELAELPLAASIEVPLLYHNELIGTLGVGEVGTSRKFTEADVRLLSLFASHAAGAVYSARLFDAERRRRQDAETLREAAAALSSSLEPDRVLDHLLTGLAQVVPYGSSSVLLLDGESVRAVAGRGFPDPEGLIGRPFPAENELLRIIYETRQPLILPDAQADARFQNWTQGLRIRSWMGVPLIAHGEMIGYLTLNNEQPDVYKQADAEMALAFASQAAAAIENSRLYHQLNRRVQQLSGLHSIDVAIASSTDLRVTLNVILNAVTSLLNVDAADVLIYDPVLQTLQYRSGRGFRGSEITGTSIRLGHGLAGRCVLEKEPVYVLSGLLPDWEAGRGRLVEAEGFKAYACTPLMAKGEVKGVLEVFRRSPLEVDDDWKEFLDVLAGQAAIAVDSAGLFESLQASNFELVMAYDATIEGWSRALDLRDKETEGHTQRVTLITLELAARMGVSEAERVHIRRGALLHDMGKLGVPDHILLKPGGLSEEEWAVMRQHPQYAYEMLKPIKFLNPALDIPYCHHERWDGSGYPRGLKGEQIPLAARIFAVADVWDALCSDRPYRPAWPKEKAREYIRSQAGIQFDPKVVEAFLELDL